MIQDLVLPVGNVRRLRRNLFFPGPRPFRHGGVVEPNNRPDRLSMLRLIQEFPKAVGLGWDRR
jgi:hypothetical protein